MTFHRTTTALLALFAAMPAFAQDGPLTADGEIGIYYLHQGSDNDTFLVGDTDLSYSFGNFGLDLSLIGLAENGDTATAIFGGGSFTLGNGMKFVVGAPRSAFDQFGRAGFGRANKLQSYERFYGGSSILTTLELQDNLDDLGLAFSMGGESGLGFSASYHKVDDVSADILAFGASYATGTYQIEGAYEHFDGASGNAGKLKLSGHMQLGLLDAGAYLAYAREGSADATYAEVNGDYELTDRINLGGSFGYQFATGSDESLVSAYGAYEVFDGAKASLGILKPESEDTIYQLGIGLEF